MTGKPISIREEIGMATTGEALLTAEEFAALPNDGERTELVRGRVVTLNLPAPRHGQIASKVDRIVGRFLDDNDLGHLVINDAAVVTERDPDSVRGGDVSFYSYSRVPRGPFPRGYIQAVPDAIFEVRSPTDRWSKILAKVAECLGAGVIVVCVLDDLTENIHIYRDGEAVRVLGPQDELTLPEVLPGFKAVVKRFFE
jgi:Uma2 family endonuclease